jgi:hypothetical protein
MGFSQQSISPLPALVHKTSLLQTSQEYRFPSWAIVFLLPADDAVTFYFFSSLGLPQHTTSPLPARVTMISLPHSVHT